ncbi:MAG: CBS domain-containing protein [Acidiferrobacterales bacterium]
MKHIPLIKSVMTPFPYSIETSAPIRDAQVMMTDHDIGHLPVKENGKLVSVITDRDIRSALQPSAGRSEHELCVGDVCVAAYVVELTERLDSVLLHLAHHDIDSAVVVKNGKLVGIFTTTDACRCYGQYLRSLFPVGDGHDAA